MRARKVATLSAVAVVVLAVGTAFGVFLLRSDVRPTTPSASSETASIPTTPEAATVPTRAGSDINGTDTSANPEDLPDCQVAPPPCFSATSP